MKQITRTIETHVIKPAIVKIVDGNLIPEPLDDIVVFNDTMSDTKALKLVKKEHGKDKQVIILAIETTSETYAVDFDVFMQYAKVVEKKKDEFEPFKAVETEKEINE